MLATYQRADGLGDGSVNDLRFDPEGTLWAATAGGLSRLKNGRFATLSSKNGLPCDGVHWSLEDDDHALWRYMPCGLVRIARAEWEAWSATADKDGRASRTIQATVFDNSDGARSLSSVGFYTPHAAKSPDGKLWFSSLDGLSVIDPRRRAYNKRPPPVSIEAVAADHKTYDVASGASGNLRLPPLVRDLEIDFTALSFAAPEKVRFRYKLEGRDKGWQDAGNRRQAFYNDLPPRAYRFRVIACNNSGVWNEAGSLLDFSIAPAFYQTDWFRASTAAVFLGLVVVLYRLRLRQVAARFNIRMEERVNERTRIARDLHDTMLQSFQAALMKLHSVTFMLDDGSQVRTALERVITQAVEAVAEGRSAVQGLRSSMVVTNDLARAISGLAEETASGQIAHERPEFRLHVKGASKDLAPIVRDDVHRIISEAIRNAFRHGQAKAIEVEIRYDRRELLLRVQDDGKGIDEKVLSEGGRPGHFGLAGMRERARTVGGKLAIRSKRDSGTVIELTVPAGIAYAKSGSARAMVSARRT